MKIAQHWRTKPRAPPDPSEKKASEHKDTQDKGASCGELKVPDAGDGIETLEAPRSQQFLENKEKDGQQETWWARKKREYNNRVTELTTFVMGPQSQFLDTSERTGVCELLFIVILGWIVFIILCTLLIAVEIAIWVPIEFLKFMSEAGRPEYERAAVAEDEPQREFHMPVPMDYPVDPPEDDVGFHTLDLGDEAPEHDYPIIEVESKVEEGKH